MNKQQFPILVILLTGAILMTTMGSSALAANPVPGSSYVNELRREAKGANPNESEEEAEEAAAEFEAEQEESVEEEKEWEVIIGFIEAYMPDSIGF